MRKQSPGSPAKAAWHPSGDGVAAAALTGRPPAARQAQELAAPARALARQARALAQAARARAQPGC